jgi:hypothetical protein
LASFDSTDLYETWGGDGSISADPRFVDPLREDFSLADGSPAIGAGKDGADIGRSCGRKRSGSSGTTRTRAGRST